MTRTYSPSPCFSRMEIGSSQLRNSVFSVEILTSPCSETGPSASRSASELSISSGTMVSDASPLSAGAPPCACTGSDASAGCGLSIRINTTVSTTTAAPAAIRSATGGFLPVLPVCGALFVAFCGGDAGSAAGCAVCGAGCGACRAACAASTFAPHAGQNCAPAFSGAPQDLHTGLFCACFACFAPHDGQNTALSAISVPQFEHFTIRFPLALSGSRLAW